MNKKTLKSGTNKGSRRIWVEGDFLRQNGVQNGQRFTKSIDGDCLTLTICQPGPRTHKIAGTPARPIIDLCGAWVTLFMGSRANFTVTINGGQIAIRPCS